MDLGHLHIATVHLPVIAIPVFLILQIFAQRYQSLPLRNAALIGFIALALFTIPIYLTGEYAEDLANGLPGVTDHQIEEHEEAATIAFVAVLLTGVMSLLSFAAGKFRVHLVGAALKATMVLALITSGLLAWTANQGGKVRHTEIR